jgi:hypothetical protein
MEIFRYFAIATVAASGVLLSGASGVQAATVCTSATAADFGGSTANLQTWIDGTNGGSDDFVTVNNGSLMCEFSDLGRTPLPNGNTPSSSETTTEINDNFFTSAVSSWSSVEKEDGSFTTTGFLQTSGSNFGSSGNWKILDSFFDTYDFGLLVFQDGSNDPEPFIGYKVTQTADGDVTGTYSSMFFNANGLTGDAVSHISLFGGTNDDPGVGIIPLPAGLPLLLSALGLGGLLRLRQRKAA